MNELIEQLEQIGFSYVSNAIYGDDRQPGGYIFYNSGGDPLIGVYLDTENSSFLVAHETPAEEEVEAKSPLECLGVVGQFLARHVR